MPKRILFLNIRNYKIERITPLLAAKKLGVSLVLVCDKVPDVLPAYFEEVLVTDTFDVEKVLKEVEDYHQTHPFDGVVTWSDKDVPLVARIGEKLNLPTLSVASSLAVRNKGIMREKVSAKAPEVCPKFQRVTSFEELEEAVEAIGFPAIFKPVGASGSKSIFKIKKEEDLNEIYQMMCQSTDEKKDKIYTYFPNQYIYEALLEGDEISIDGFVVNGKAIIAGITDKKVTDDFSLEYQEIFPSRHYNEQDDPIFRSFIEKVVHALALDNTSFHAECKFDVQTKKLKLIEIAGRPGGGFITSHLIPLVSRHSFHEAVIQLAVNGEIEEQLDIAHWWASKKGFSGHLDLLEEREGKVLSVEGLDKVLEDTRVIFSIPTVKTGHRVVLPPQNFGAQYMSASVVFAPTYEEVEETFTWIQEVTQVEMEEG